MPHKADEIKNSFENGTSILSICFLVSFVAIFLIAMKGINTLQLYIDGFSSYLYDINDEEIKMEPFSGENSVYDGEKIVVGQIEKEIPIPFLLLKHKNKKLNELVWHWFLIVGYEKTEDDLLVKIATYGKYNWISFKNLWDTGYDEKGGMIIIIT